MSCVLRNYYERALNTHETLEPLPREDKARDKKRTRKWSAKMPLPPPPPPVPPPFPALSKKLESVFARADSEMPTVDLTEIGSNEELQALLQDAYRAGYEAGLSEKLQSETVDPQEDE